MNVTKWRIRWMRAKVRDLYWAWGSRNKEAFAEAKRCGEGMYRLTREIGAKTALEIREHPSYAGAFVADALAEGGRMITILTNGGRVNSQEFIPKSLRGRWFFKSSGDINVLSDVPDASADVVILEENETAWREKAWAAVKPGGIISDHGVAAIVVSKEKPVLLRKVEWCDAD